MHSLNESTLELTRTGLYHATTVLLSIQLQQQYQWPQWWLLSEYHCTDHWPPLSVFAHWLQFSTLSNGVNGDQTEYRSTAITYDTLKKLTLNIDLTATALAWLLSLWQGSITSQHTVACRSFQRRSSQAITCLGQKCKSTLQIAWLVLANQS